MYAVLRIRYDASFFSVKKIIFIALSLMSRLRGALAISYALYLSFKQIELLTGL